MPIGVNITQHQVCYREETTGIEQSRRSAIGHVLQDLQLAMHSVRSVHTFRFVVFIADIQHQEGRTREALRTVRNEPEPE